MLNSLFFLLALPLTGMLLLALLNEQRQAAQVNIIVSALTFFSSLVLAWKVLNHGPQFFLNELFYIDAFNVYLLALTAFVGLTTALFSQPYMQHELEIERINKLRLRLYHTLYQGFMLSMLVALSTNNLGLLWVAMEAATLATVLLVSLYRTPESIEAAWKYFILCGVGIAQALFGTVLLYFAAAQILPAGDGGLLWTTLHQHAAQLNAGVMSIAFVFLLIGYGTKVGLVPLHNWLPDAHSEGPTPMSAVLSGLLLNVALYALVRVKVLVDGSLNTELAGWLMMGFGLVSFLVAGFFLHRQNDIKRLYSYSSIEHMGLMTFAFGLGTPLANLAGLLHMTVHSLTKSAIFVTVGYACQLTGSQSMDKIRGLMRVQPNVGWGLLLGTAAIAGFPPFGVFASEFMLLFATMKSWPWLSVPLLVGLAVAFAGLFRHLHPVVYGDISQEYQPIKINMLPVYVHLALVLWLGLAIPGFLSNWFQQVSALLIGH